MMERQRGSCASSSEGDDLAFQLTGESFPSSEPTPHSTRFITPPESASTRSAGPESEPARSIAPESDFHTKPIRLLLVDDDPETARGIERTLSLSGHEIVSTRSGRAGLEAFQKERFDVVLSDIGMPEMDGFDLCLAIRQHDAHVPIVLLTGDPTVSTAARALEVGAFRYVTKPVDPESLSQVVEKAARLRRMAQAKAQAAKILGQESLFDTDFESLGHAFDRCLEGLWMAFQPIVDPRGRTVFGYESLLRSRERALPHPGAVLDAAERLGRLDELGHAIWRATASEIPSAAGAPSFFVNLHVRDLLDPSLLDPRSPLTPFASQIVLEVTERASLNEVPDVRQRVAALRELGFRIAVDDLGAGYAGLTSFALLEPELVKLDMSLVREVEKSPTKRKVIRSMVNLAQDMGMLVVAEGVETPAERDTLIELGCDLLQGYLYARPSAPFPEAIF